MRAVSLLILCLLVPSVVRAAEIGQPEAQEARGDAIAGIAIARYEGSMAKDRLEEAGILNPFVVAKYQYGYDRTLMSVDFLGYGNAAYGRAEWTLARAWYFLSGLASSDAAEVFETIYP